MSSVSGEPRSGLQDDRRTPASLAERHADATRRLIVATAVELLARSGVTELTMRAVAQRAGMSERTLFRYFATRDAFLDAAAAEAVRVLAPPPPPATLEALLAYPAPLYRRFEDQAALVTALLHTDLFARIRDTVAQDRWRAVRAIVDRHAPHRDERERRIAAANVRFHLAASAWHYYRTNFGFGLEESIECAQAAVRATLDDVMRR